MGTRSEREYREKLNKISERMGKRTRNIRKDFEKVEKMKIIALRKTEEIRASTDNEVEKMEREITKSRDLAPESKERLHSEILLLRNRIGKRYGELRVRISETMIPTLEAN